jgi:NDP-sugar pyrophosphorylase family protein
MADVDGRPFLEYLVGHLSRAGVSEVILCIGYKGDVIVDHFGRGGFGVPIDFVHEPTPLGTAGALRLALPKIGERALALNGDTFADVNLAQLVGVHREERALVTLAAVRRDDASRFGTLRVDGRRLLGFEEKRGGGGLINAGVYVFERAALATIPEGRAVSLERELLPQLIAAKERIAVVRHEGYFEDMGTPDGLAAFRAVAPGLIRGTA